MFGWCVVWLSKPPHLVGGPDDEIVFCVCLITVDNCVFFIWLQLAKDLLHPLPAEEKRKHKLKRLVQHPNSYFMDVKCPGCYKITTVFSHAQGVVVCAGCSTILCQPTGGRAKLTEGITFSEIVWRSTFLIFVYLFRMLIPTKATLSYFREDFLIERRIKCWRNDPFMMCFSYLKSAALAFASLLIADKMWTCFWIRCTIKRFVQWHFYRQCVYISICWQLHLEKRTWPFCFITMSYILWHFNIIFIRRTKRNLKNLPVGNYSIMLRQFCLIYCDSAPNSTFIII